MEENVGKLGIVDFFNVLFTGGIFVICASWINPWFWDQYIVINGTHKNESYVGIIIVFFIIGMILQEIGSLLDSKVTHIKDDVLNYFLFKEIPIDGPMKYKLKKWIKNKFHIKKQEKEKVNNYIIDNLIKLKIYREHGKKILKKKEEKYSGEFKESQCRFIYAYCLYYIENQGKSGKYEKMRGLFDLARTMISSSILLLIESFIMLFYNIKISHNDEMIKANFAQILIFAICAIIFYYRAQKIMNYKTRMLMEVYDVCMDIKEEGV